jgi:iron complex transport system permease protein
MKTTTTPSTLAVREATELLPMRPAATRGQFFAKRTAFVFAAVLLLLAAATAAVTVGSTHVDLQVTLRVIGAKLFPFWISVGQVSRADEVIIWLIRVPRVIVAAFVGAGLAVAGALMQGLFRNPLAEPNIVGVGSGAVLGAVAVFAAGLTPKSAYILPLAAFCGALLSLVTVYTLATRGGVTPISTLLLIGIALASLLGAASSLLISLSLVNLQVAQEILFWMMGGLDSRTWTHVWISVPFILFGIFVSLYYGRDLDLLVQGEEAAAALGVEVESSKRVIIVMSALITGSAVAVAGVIGFVGLIVPHVVRLFVGPAHRTLLPSSAVAGATFLIACDLLARTVKPPTEIRLGIITAAFGAPFFLFLLLRKSREVSRL